MFFCFSAFSQDPGSLDLNFNGTGIVTTDIIQGNTDFSKSIIVQPDGKIIAAGYTSNASSDDFVIARYNPDGSLDNSFGTNGIVVANSTNQDDCFNSVALTPSGKIVAGGYVYNGSNKNFLVARFMPDGNLDNTFGNNGIVNTDVSNFTDEVNSILVQPDGKIVAAGYAEFILNNFAIARYKTNGDLDNTFSYDGIVTTEVNNWDSRIKGAALQSDLKIVVVGYGNSNIALARYMPDGLLDNTFNSNGIVITDIFECDDEKAYDVALKTNGKILIAGSAHIISSNERFLVAQYTSNGILDNSFGTDGYQITDVSPSGNAISRSIAIQEDEKIILAGDAGFYTNDIVLVRYLADGTSDYEFGNNGIVITDYWNTDQEVYSLAIQPDLKILVAGNTYSPGGDFILARYHSGLYVGTENKPQSISEIDVYPNPFENQINFSITNKDVSEVNVQIFDISGKTVIDINERVVNNTITLNTYLKPGIYFYKIATSSFTESGKIIRVK